MRLIVVFFFLAFFYQCGLPNPYDFGNNANPPYKIESRSINNNIYLTVYSYNQKQIRELIDGYNVFFNYNNDISSIGQNIIYLDRIRSLPSIKYFPKDDYYSFEIKIEGSFSYGQIVDASNTNVTENRKIDPFTSYYFIITPVTKIEDLSKNRFFIIQKETTEYNEMQKTIPSNSTYDYAAANIAFSVNGANTYITGVNGSSAQDMGAFDSFFDVKQAPEGGYSDYPLLVIPNHIYVYKTQATSASPSHYGKFFIRSTDPNFTTVDFSYQGKDGENEI